ncbi:MAG TPA: protein kinase [Micromonosporaceae bacterium]|jgi:serine/threonine-protein kinase
MSAFTPGLRLHDRFILDDRIGLGGMSEVWRATDAVLGRTVAVKALSSPLAADPVLRAATWREARAAARLTHPNVTQVYDYGEATLPDGAVVPYLVMEFVDGQSLADRLSHGPLPWPEATAIGAQVAAALAAAHRLGVVHRDVKPGNVMLTPTGAKVLDFGIAALAGAGGDTDAGWLVGTPAYAAPERLRPGPAQPASDVYALGVLLYEMMTGRRPMPARSWDDAEAAHRAYAPIPPLDVPGLPRRVARLVVACLSAGPDERPSAEELAVALAAAAGQPDPTPMLPPADATARLAPAGYAVGAASLPHPPTMVERTPLEADAAGGGLARPPGRSRLLLVGVLGGVAALVLGAILVAAALQSGNRSGSGTAAPTGPSTAGPATSSASPTAQSPTAAPQGRDQIIAALGQLIDAAGLPKDDAARLQEDLAALADNRGKGNVRKRATELRRDIDKLMEEGRLDLATGNQLIALLEPLTGGGGDGD